MNKKLYYNNKIEVRKSDIHGFGVFAKKEIKSGELLEECHYIQITKEASKDVYIRKYFYHWPRHREAKVFALVFGNGSIYNSSSSKKEMNADWKCDENQNLYIFKAVKDIPADTEILIYYGEHYWNKNLKKN